MEIIMEIGYGNWLWNWLWKLTMEIDYGNWEIDYGYQL